MTEKRRHHRSRPRPATPLPTFRGKQLVALRGGPLTPRLTCLSLLASLATWFCWSWQIWGMEGEELRRSSRLGTVLSEGPLLLGGAV